MKDRGFIKALIERAIAAKCSALVSHGRFAGDQMVRLTVQHGVSDHSAGMVFFSLAVFTLLYGVLAVIWFWLMRRYIVEGPQEHDSEPAPPAPPDSDDVAPLSFAY